MILQVYFARRFLWSFTMVLSVFALLVFLVDLIDKLQDFPDLTFGAVTRLVVLNLPSKNYEILPLVVILAAVALFVRMARSSELVAVRAAGVSGLKNLVAPVVVTLAIGGVAVTLFNPVVAATSKRFNDLRNLHEDGGTSVLALSEEGLWLRQAEARGQTLIHAKRASSDLGVLFGTTFMRFDPDGRPTLRINAAAARLADGEWVLHDAKIWDLRRGGNPEADAATARQTRLASTLTRDRIVNSFGKPQFIPMWDLPAFIAQLEKAGFSARRYIMWFQMELARPLFLAALVMVAAAFTMRPARLSNMGLSVLAAVMLGFSLHYIRNFAQILGENGEIPLALAAWAPPVASWMLALGILLHKEDG